MKGETGKIIPGIKKLIDVEAGLKALAQNEPPVEIEPKIKTEPKWVPPTPEELRESRKGMGKRYLGDL